MAVHSLSSAIINTLCYSDHFNFPLTAEEIHLRLQSNMPHHLEIVLKRLNFLVNQHQIEKKGVYYFLPARSKLVSRRSKYASLSQPLLSKARFLAHHLSLFSSNILAIYLTGSLAVGNTNGNSDIDLMIITKPHKLWTTRFLLTIYTTLFHLRRTPSAPESPGKLCLNLYLTSDSFALPPSKRTLYSAYELIQAIPLFDPYHTHSALLSSNFWIKKYLSNYPIPKRKHSSSQPKNNTLLEELLFRLQYLYMKRRITREYITRDAAFFHPRDPGYDVMQKLS